MITLAIDLETYYADDYSLARKDTNMLTYILDDRFILHGGSVETVGQNNTTWAAGESIVSTIKSIVGDKPWRMVGHNVMFDAMVLAARYNLVADNYACTASMARGMEPELSASLKAVAERTFPNDPTMRKGTELVDSKGKRTLSDDELTTLAGYCNQDTRLCAAIYTQLREQGFPESELDSIDTTVKMYVKPRFVLDRPLLEKTIKDEAAKREKIKNAALDFIKDALNGAYYNPNEAEAKKRAPMDHKVFTSNDRFAKLLTEVFDLTVPMKTSPTTGKQAYAFGKTDVPYIDFQNEHPDLKPLWDARASLKSSIAATRAESMLKNTLPDGRFPIPLKYYGARTGRYAGIEGVNVQNFQRNSNHRLALTSLPKELVYVSDLSNIEARVLAWFAGQEDALEVYRAKGDLYKRLAARIYNKPEAQITKDERSLGKVATLGLGYGMGWSTFQRTLAAGPMGLPPMKVDDEFAIRVVNLYRSENHKVPQLWEQANNIIANMAQHDCDMYWNDIVHVTANTLTMPNGMRLRYDNLRYTYDGWTYDTRNGSTKIYGGKLVENLIQALARIVIAEQMNTIQKEILSQPIVTDHGYGQIALQVHDEVIFTAPHLDAEKHIDDDGNETWKNNDYEESIMAETYRVMRNPPHWCPDLPLDAEGGYDFCYSK